MRAFRTVLALSMVSFFVSAPAALAQSTDPHHPPAASVPAQVQPAEQPSSPAAAPQEPGQQPAQPPQDGMTMNCAMMHGGQTGTSGTTNCPMKPSEDQATHPGMMHGQMRPGRAQPVPR